MAFIPRYIGQADGAIGGEITPEPLQTVLKIGNTLWALPDTVAGTNFKLYRSGDSGVTWNSLADLPYTTDGLTIWAHIVVFHEGLIRVIAAWPSVSAPLTGPFTLMMASIDPKVPTPAWSAWTTLPFGATVLNRNDGLRMYADVRPDGSLLFAYSELNGLQEATRVRSFTLGTWSDLGQITAPAGFNNYVTNGLIGSSGIAYLFFNVVDQSTGDVTLQTSTVTSGNTIGAFQNVASMGTVNGFNYNRGVIRGNGTLCVGYSVGAAGTDLSVAFGDTSVDPLNPIWTNAAVTTATDYQGGASLAELGTTLWVYYTEGPGLFAGGIKLYRSSWSGSAWNAREIWLDPTTLTPSVSSVIDFQLVPGFSGGGVGLILDAGFDFSGNFEFLAYDGPKIATRRNFGIAGGAGGIGNLRQTAGWAG